MSAGFQSTDKMTANVDRGLPWWVGVPGQEPGEFVRRHGFATVEEAVKEGGLDFEVALRPLLTTGKGGRLTKIATHSAVVRLDNGDALGVVGRKYRPIQYAEGLGGFGKAILATDEAAVDTAGTLFGGKTGFLWFEVNHLPIKIKGERPEGEIKTYLGITSSHDGSSALTAMITPVRVVCQNTLNFAIRGAHSTFKVRHSGSVDGKVEEARKALTITRDYMADFEAIAQRLAGVKVPDNSVKGLMEAIWPVKAELSEGWTDRHPAVLATEDYFTSANLDPIRGTAWAVLNAAVEYVDHEAPYRGRLNDLTDVRAAAVLWGRGARAKDRALAVVKDFAGIN